MSQDDGRAALRVRTTDAILVAALTIAGRGFFILLQMIAARSLGVVGYGLFTIAWTPVTLAAAVANLGMHQAILKYRATGRAFWFDLYFPLTLVGGGALTVLLMVTAEGIASGWFGKPEAAPLIRTMAPIAALTALSLVLGAVARCQGRATVGAALYPFATFLLALAGIAVAHATGGRLDAAALAWVLAVAHIPAVLALGVVCIGHRSPTASVAWTEIVRFGSLSMALHATNVFNLWADRFFLGALGTIEQVAFYQAAAQLAMIPVMIKNSLLSVYGAHWSSADPAARTVLFERCSSLFFQVLAPAIVVGAVFADLWISLFFGAAFDAGALALVILLTGGAITVCIGPSLVVLHFAAANVVAPLLAVLGLALNAGLNLSLIGPLGELGAALATAATQVVVATCALIMIVKYRLVHGVARGLLMRLLGLGLLALTAVVARKLLGGVGPDVMLGLAIFAVLHLLTIAVAAFPPCRLPNDDIAAAVHLRYAPQARRRLLAAAHRLRPVRGGLKD